MAALAAVLFALAVQAQDGPQKLAAVRLQAGIHNISAELAMTPQQREIGLMNRTSMGANEGCCSSSSGRVSSASG
jgi:hypothetical protein